MNDINALLFDGVELHKWAPGFQSQLVGNWAEHKIPGQRGALQEDLGDGALGTKITLQFVGKTSRSDYNQVMAGLMKNRRGELHHPIRGSKLCILSEVTESMEWTKQGNAIRVDLTFKEAVLHTPDSFSGGPATQAQEVLSYASELSGQAGQFQETFFAKHPLEVSKRTAVLKAITAVQELAEEATAYAHAALAAFQSGQLGLTLRTQLCSLPALVSEAEDRLRQSASFLQTQALIATMERCLYAATQLDAAIRENLPPPIVTVITSVPGQSIYSFVQTWFSEKTQSQQLGLIDTILALNRGIRTPSLIPTGFGVIRPAS